MNKYLCSVAIAILLHVSHAHAQDTSSAKAPGHPISSVHPVDVFNLGVGFGQDYGGIGGNITLYPQRNIGLFAGFGYAIAGFGYNAGIKLRLLPNKGNSVVRPFLEAMYGYNAAIGVSNNPSYNKLFFGPTAGAGLDIGRITRRVGGSLSLAILIPFRSPDVNNYMNQLTGYGVSFSNHLSSVTFSIGYKIVLI